MPAATSRRPPPLSPPPQASGSGDIKELSVQQLRDTIHELQLLQKKFIDKLRLNEGHDDLDTMEQEDSDTMFRITTDMVFHFINEVHYADRYWDMKEYLSDLPVYSSNKDWQTDPCLEDLPIQYTSGSVFDEYIKELGKSVTHFNIDKEDVWRCVSCHISDLRRKIGLKRQAEEVKKSTWLESDTFAHKHPIWSIVLQARKNEYVMKSDPRVELENIKECVPLCTFYHYWRGGPRIDKDKTVMVPNVSPYTHGSDVEKLLSKCGDIDFVAIESRRGNPRTVYVTFKDSQGAKSALQMDSLYVRGRVVKIKTPESAAAIRKSKNVGDPAVEEAFGKYRKLVEKFTRLSNEVKDDVNNGNAKKGGKPAKKHKRRGPSSKKVGAQTVSNEVKDDVRNGNAMKAGKPAKKHKRRGPSSKKDGAQTELVGH